MPDREETGIAAETSVASASDAAHGRRLPPFVDRPGIDEVFSDGVHSVTAGGDGVLRLALTVTRPTDGAPPSFNRLLSSRIVLTLPAAVDLHRRLGEVLGALQRRTRPSAAPGHPL